MVMQRECCTEYCYNNVSCDGMIWTSHFQKTFGVKGQINSEREAQETGINQLLSGYNHIERNI